jgi:hypothetical protein
MARLFFREVWSFPHAYQDARRYQVSLEPEDSPLEIIALGEEDTTETWVGRRDSWGEALIGALPFLLFGLAYLLKGFAELGGFDYPSFKLLYVSFLESSLDRPAIIFTPPMGVYFISTLGLLLGVVKGFPRWSYAYLGMSLYFGWYYGNGSFSGVHYDSWAWLPLFAVIILGLALARSLQPLVRLLKGGWNDWTRLSFALYAFVPMLTVVFFDDDWEAIQLSGLFVDTVLLAAGAVAFLRARTVRVRVLSLLAAVLIVIVKAFALGGWFWQAFLFIISLYLGILLLPAVIGLFRRGVDALSAR